ncbi:MAG: hypothetical protein SOU80_06205, partial [Alphaproteobacteria bacterium]|nr:hypothetical protein [Alphaproteobacteria bacterium]
ACEDTYLISDGACVPECDKSADTCAAENKVFNAETCICEACPTNYQFNSETKACEQIACDKTKVEHCATYDSEYEPCTCQACELNYLLVDGICVLQCSGANQCLYQGSCVTCYESCPVRWQYYLDEELDGSVCSVVERIYQGSGYGAEATYKPCYNDCATCQKACELFAGLDNTTDAVAQLGDKGLAVYVATQFYVGNKNGAFGQGQWYLPSIGEWMEFYGTEISNAIPAEYSSAGATGDNMALIKNALNTLKNKGVEAEPLSGYYWSSTSRGSSNVAALNASDGRSGSKCSYYACSSSGETSYVRCSLFLTLTTNGTAPAIGDVVYLDKTYGAASDYDGSKTPVGIIAAVSGNDVKIINLKNLTFSSKNTVGNFDPDNPYSGITEQTAFLPKNSIYLHDITGNFVSNQFSNAISVMNKYNCTCPFKPGACTLSTATCAAQSKTFNEGSCACEACPENQYFNSDYQTCECVDGYTESSNGSTCCQDIEGCASYDMSCSCTRCNDTRLMGSGGCYLATFCDFENCNAYHCESCKAYFCEDYKTCWPTNNICKDCSPAMSGSWFRPWKGSLDEQNNACKDRYARGRSVESKSYCAPGAIMYDDFKCYPTEQSDKTPIGVAAYVSKDKVLVLALDDSDERELLSGTASVYINCNSNNGKEQTECLVANGIEEYSAPAYCNSYGVTEADKGKWFLPTNSEFETIYEHYLTKTLAGYTSSEIASYTYKGQFCFTVQTLHKYNDPSSDILEYVNSKFLNRNFWTSTRGDYQASLTLTMGHTASPVYKRVQNGERGLVRCVLAVPFEDTVL